MRACVCLCVVVVVVDLLVFIFCCWFVFAGLLLIYSIKSYMY